MSKITVVRGCDKPALVDDVVFDYVKLFKWKVSTDGRYPIVQLPAFFDKRTVSMHEMVVYWYAERTKSREHEIDHKNGNGFDNRLENLRLCTRQQNMFNTKPRYGSSIYKGVFQIRTTGKYRAQIRVNHKNIMLGEFDSEKDAALAYDGAAFQYRGEFARLNFPRNDSQCSQKSQNPPLLCPLHCKPGCACG